VFVGVFTPSSLLTYLCCDILVVSSLLLSVDQNAKQTAELKRENAIMVGTVCFNHWTIVAYKITQQVLKEAYHRLAALVPQVCLFFWLHFLFSLSFFFFFSFFFPLFLCSFLFTSQYICRGIASVSNQASLFFSSTCAPKIGSPLNMHFENIEPT